MSNKIFIILSILVILLISIFIGVFIARKIIFVPTTNNDALNNIAEVSKEDEDRQEEIIFTSYLYDKDSPIEYVIKEQEKIKNIHINLQKAMDRHDIEGCFKAHEAIHDYDYWIINYPAYFDTFPATDWGGVDVYFGNIQ
ncbi:MAG: hypothetical protein HFJ57_03815 [Clostridia bacterium]|nr:hypothetical protein [Clostridia bacterium]